MDINVQLLNKLNEEIDAASADIKAKEAEWKNETNAENKAFYAQSIRRLEDKEKDLIASRDRIITNASSSYQGKDISMTVSPPSRKAIGSSARELCDLRYPRRVFKCYRFALAFDLYWCIRERLRRQWGVYHNILHLFVIQQVVDVFELKCVLKTCCGCLRFVFFSYVFN